MRMRFWLGVLGLACLPGCFEEKVQVYTIPKSTPAPPRGEMPAGHPHVGEGEEMTFTPPNPADWKWTAPEDWTDRGPTAVYAALFDVPGPAGQGECSISILGGTGGGLIENINRWRRQMALEPLDEEGLVHQARLYEIDGRHALVVDFKGSYTGMRDTAARPDYRMLGAITLTPGGTLFVKFVGPEATVQGQVEGFFRLLDSVKTPR